MDGTTTDDTTTADADEWRPARSPQQRERDKMHVRAWDRWDDRRMADRAWLRLADMAEQYVKKCERNDDDVKPAEARREGYRRLRQAIDSNEFCIDGDSRVLIPGSRKAYWMTREILKAAPGVLPDEQDRHLHDNPDGLIDVYLSRCWVPSDLAARWFDSIGLPKPADMFPPAVPKPAAVAGTIAAEHEMTRWLTTLMRANPLAPITKATAHEMAVAAELRSISKRRFDAAWLNAVSQSGASAWSAGGRRKSPHLIAAPD